MHGFFATRTDANGAQAVAVLRPELRDYVGVIIVSTKGHYVNGKLLDRHLCSMTGGGLHSCLLKSRSQRLTPSH